MKIIGYIIATNEWLEFEDVEHAACHFDVTKMQVKLVMQGVYTQVKGVCFHNYTDDFDEQIFAKLNRPHNKGQHSKKGIAVYDLEGKPIATFNGVREAARELGISKTTVSRCANGKRNNDFFTFKFI